MSLVATTVGWEALLNALSAAGVYTSIDAAVASGAVQIIGDSAVGGLVLAQQGAGTAISTFADALTVARTAHLGATATSTQTGALTLARTATGFRLMGTATLTLPTAAAVIAPLAGVGIGYDMWRANPSLWANLSQVFLPFCYGEDRLRAFIDYEVDAITGRLNPAVLVPNALLSALVDFFTRNGVHPDPGEEWESPYGTISLYPAPPSRPFPSQPLYPYYRIEGHGLLIRVHYNEINDYVYCTELTKYRSKYAGGTNLQISRGWNLAPATEWDIWGIPVTEGLTYHQVDQIIRSHTDTSTIAPTAGTVAPSVPIEPTVWPNSPIIIVPDPLGPDYQPIPVTPITPLPLPAPDPVPQLPPHEPDPTPDRPDEWPDEDPWPTTVPFPIQPTEPDPDWPPYMPWPLPDEPPEEWPLHPDGWPWPDELPWPRHPDEWPDDVPWPDDPPNPDEWPDGVPWPDTPDDWPDEVPWPVPWPDDWPDDAPWPIHWPPELPYPWPFPYPVPSPDPYEPITDPDEQVDPYIDPWPFELPDPFPDQDDDPDPYIDPNQPYPSPRTDPQPDDPLPPVPPSGTIDPPIGPIIPLPFSSTTGLISVYHPTQSELLSFANWLWVTWHDATIEKIWNNPFDGVITLFELYCTPTDVGRKNIRSGFLDSGVSSETISRYTEIDCGTVGVPEYYGNYFDYSPYSKCHIYLPFIGIVELNVDDIVGHAVNVTYKIDEYNGSCIALITVAKSTLVNGEYVDYCNIMYEFSGNCAVDLPIAGGSQAAIKAGMIEAAAWGIGSVIGGVMGGNSLGQIGQGLAYGISSAVHSVVSAKSSVQHSGSFGSSYGAMGVKKPYIIITRPKEIQVPNYNKLYGYPAHKSVRIGECSGYVRCREVHVVSATASDEEKTLIEQLLKTGVYVTE